MKKQFSTFTCVFGVYCFLSSFSKSSLECQTDWIKIKPNVRLDLGPSYLQKLSADETKIVGKELTFLFVGHRQTRCLRMRGLYHQGANSLDPD